MTSKEFLDRPYHIKKKIRYLELELDRYHTMIYSIPTPSFNAVRVDKSPSKETPNQIGLEKYYETQDKIAEKKEELERVIEEITTVIDELENDDYKTLLKERYIMGKSFVEIGQIMFISYATIKRWHRLSLDLIKVPNIS